MNRNSLKFKVGFFLVIALTVAACLFTFLIVRNTRDELLQQAVGHAAQLSEAVIKSTRFAMLENIPSFVDKIVRDVAAEKDIVKVRILSKNGTIMHSSDAAEIGLKVDQKAEACVACHLVERKRGASTSRMKGRPRIFSDQSGRRLLGTTAVIPNEPSCSNGACHVHRKSQSVLGVLDIVYPLDKIDKTIRDNTITPP